ncbi:MAG: heme ABC exporter ATP-binding protein CcmA [Acidobacteriota bacterium]
MSRAASPAVEIHGIKKHFGSATALDGVDLTVSRGEFLSIFGPNGAGKTTLIRILSTLARPSAGKIRLFGRDLATEGTALRRRIGVVSHKSFLYEALSAYQNLSFYARMFDIDNARDRVLEILQAVRLTHRMHDPVHTFSRGLQQRCAIARALVHHPDLLLLDEPFTGLDPGAADRLSSLLRTLHASSITIVLTSHDLARSTEMADRFAFLSRGKMIYQGRSEALPDGGILALYRSKIAGSRP